MSDKWIFAGWRYGTRFEEKFDVLGGAVAYAVEGMFQNRHAIGSITGNGFVFESDRILEMYDEAHDR